MCSDENDKGLDHVAEKKDNCIPDSTPQMESIVQFETTEKQPLNKDTKDEKLEPNRIDCGRDTKQPEFFLEPEINIQKEKTPYIYLSDHIKSKILSKPTSTNLDLEYKLLAKILYNKKGYFSKIECKLFDNSYYQKFKREEISDIDLYGIKFERDLCYTKIGIECKSTQNNGVDEALKIKGIQAYCDLNMVGLIKKKISNNVRLVAQKVDIQIFDEYEIRKLVELLVKDSANLMKIEREIYFLSNGIENECKDKLKGIISFINGGYWVKEHHENFHTLVKGLERLKQIELKDYQVKYFAIKLSILLSLTLLQIASQIVKHNFSSFEQSSLDLLFGGATSRREKERTYDLLSQEIGNRINPYPYYVKDYVNIISWLISSLGASSSVPMCLEQYMVCFLEGGSLERLKAFSDVELKLAKDILRFASKILAREPLFKEIMEL